MNVFKLNLLSGKMISKTQNMQSYGHTNVHFVTTLYNNAYVLHFLHCLSETLLVCSLWDIFYSKSYDQA